MYNVLLFLRSKTAEILDLRLSKCQLIPMKLLLQLTMCCHVKQHLSKLQVAFVLFLGGTMQPL